MLNNELNRKVSGKLPTGGQAVKTKFLVRLPIFPQYGQVNFLSLGECPHPGFAIPLPRHGITLFTAEAPFRDVSQRVSGAE